MVWSVRCDHCTFQPVTLMHVMVLVLWLLACHHSTEFTKFMQFSTIVAMTVTLHAPI